MHLVLTHCLSSWKWLIFKLHFVFLLINNKWLRIWFFRELSRFIAAGRLNCKIDKVGGVVETNRYFSCTVVLQCNANFFFVQAVFLILDYTVYFNLSSWTCLKGTVHEYVLWGIFVNLWRMLWTGTLRFCIVRNL